MLQLRSARDSRQTFECVGLVLQLGDLAIGCERGHLIDAAACRRFKLVEDGGGEINLSRAPFDGRRHVDCRSRFL